MAKANIVYNQHIYIFCFLLGNWGCCRKSKITRSRKNTASTSAKTPRNSLGTRVKVHCFVFTIFLFYTFPTSASGLFFKINKNWNIAVVFEASKRSEKIVTTAQGNRYCFNFTIFFQFNTFSTTVLNLSIKNNKLVFFRQAKEMKRLSQQRKETDIEYEDKKTTMSLTQAELDRENDYYMRPASPLR